MIEKDSKLLYVPHDANVINSTKQSNLYHFIHMYLTCVVFKLNLTSIDQYNTSTVYWGLIIHSGWKNPGQCFLYTLKTTRTQYIQFAYVDKLCKKTSFSYAITYSTASDAVGKKIYCILIETTVEE